MLKQIVGSILGIAITLGMLEGANSFSPLRQEQSSLNKSGSKQFNPRDKNYSALRDLENSVYEQINQYRLERGLQALKLDPLVSEQARIHSENMASGEVAFSHDGFRARVKIIDRQIPYRRAAENVAFNQGFPNPADRAILGWIDSPGHRRNIEGDFDLTGIGVARGRGGAYYFTQIFVLRD